jgi:hypothetical protein
MWRGTVHSRIRSGETACNELAGNYSHEDLTDKACIAVSETLLRRDSGSKLQDHTGKVRRLNAGVDARRMCADKHVGPIKSQIGTSLQLLAFESHFLELHPARYLPEKFRVYWGGGIPGAKDNCLTALYSIIYYFSTFNYYR